MPDNEFDNFVHRKLADHEVPVPEGAWDKVSDAQFDQLFGSTLRDTEAPVPAGMWERVNDAQFDSFIKDKLVDTEAPVPAGLWERIMPGEDSDRGGFVWFRNVGRAAAIILLITGVATAGYFLLRKDKQAAPDAAAVTSGSVSNSTQQQQTGTQPGAATGQTPGLSTAPSNPGTAENDNNSGNTAPGTERQTDAPVTTPGESSNRLQGANTVSNGLLARGYNGGNHRGGITAQGIPSTGNNNNGLTPGGISGLNEDHSNDNGSALNETPENYTFQQWSRATLVPFGRMGMTDLRDKKLVAGNHTSQVKNIIVCPTSGGNSDWYLEAYASPDIALRSFSNNSASQQYIQRKDSSESMRVGYTAGIRIVKPINDHLLAKAGVQYTQMNQKYVYRTENEVKNITVVTTRTIIRGPGDTLIVRDTSTLQQIGYKNNVVVNRFRSLDVPLTVGYQFGTNDDDLRIGINAGVIVNVSSWYQGVMLDSALATVPLQKGNSNMIYKSRIGLGLYGGISIMKKLSDDIQVFAEPYFRYNLSNMTVPNAAYNQKFSLGGLSLGIRLNLNRQ